MEISNSMQSINTLLINQISSSDNRKIEEKEESQKVEGYNTTSKLHFKLSEDISQYVTPNPTQDKIDEDVVSILAKHEDGHLKDFLKFNIHLKGSFVVYSKEEKKNSLELVTSEKFKKLTETIVAGDKEIRELRNKYGYELSGEVANLIGSEFTKDEFEEKMNLLYDRFGKEMVDNAINDNKAFKTKYNNLFASLKSIGRDFTHYVGEDFTLYYLDDEEDMTKFAERGKKGFQNTYRFSDEFAKTEKFEELLKEYKEEHKRIQEEAYKQGSYSPWDYIYNNDFLEVEKANVIKKGYSKSEWIESIDKSKTTLEDMIKDNPNMMESVKIDMQDNIKFYKNILTDLKELWHYGDFKADG